MLKQFKFISNVAFFFLFKCCDLKYLDVHKQQYIKKKDKSCWSSLLEICSRNRLVSPQTHAHTHFQALTLTHLAAHSLKDKHSLMWVIEDLRDCCCSDMILLITTRKRMCVCVCIRKCTYRQVLYSLWWCGTVYENIFCTFC